MSKANGSNKMRKVGRNAISCKAYANTNRREKNKIKKLQKHLINFPDDANAKAAIASCKAAIGIK